MALKGRKLRRRVQEIVLGDARFRIVVPGKGSVCPWCGEVAWRTARGESLVDAVMAHLEECPVAKGDPEEPLKTGVALQEIVRVSALSDKLQSELAYRIFGQDGRWLCPFCGDFQDVHAVDDDGRQRSVERLVQDISRHFVKCYEHQSHPDSHFSVQELKQRMAEISRERRLREETAALMKANPVMQFADCQGKWVCPFCRRSIGSVDMSTPFQREHAAATHAAHHLSSECPVAVRNRSLTITQAEMEAVVAGVDAEIRREKSVRPVGFEVGSDDPGATTYLKALHAEVSDLRQEVRRNEDLARSMERARQVQRKMLPRELPEVEGYELSHIFRPCDQVSGDFYDVFITPSGRLCIVIADVSGHGLDAALVMGMAKKAFNVRAQEDLSTAEIMSKVNADVRSDLEEGRFVTASLSALDIVNHTLACARAGHNPAVLWRPASGEVSLVTPSGMMMGVDRGERFAKVTKEEVIELGPGDVVVQYTDGVTETMNEAGEEFGMGRLTDAVARAGTAPADVTLGSITTAVDKFRGERKQDDDVTVLILRRLP